MEERVFQEEIYWRQRAKPKWAREGRSSTISIHKLVNGRREILLKKIELDNWIVVDDEAYDEALIEEESISFFITFIQVNRKGD